jgi:hypothetical protein
VILYYVVTAHSLIAVAFRIPVKFVKKTISIEYKDESLEYDVYLQPLWGWCQELLMDPDIVTEFSWDAQHLYRWTGDRFE